MSMLTITEACASVGKSHKTIYRHIKTGKLSASKTDEGQYRFDPSELERVYGEVKVVSRLAGQVGVKNVTAPISDQPDSESLRPEKDAVTSKLIAKLEEEVIYLRTQNAKLTALVEKAQDTAIRTLGFGSQKFSFWNLFKKSSNPD